MDYKEKLQTKINEIESLATLDSFSPKFQVWEKTTENLLKECIKDPDMVRIFTDILKTTSYASSKETKRLYIQHLKKKKEALETLVELTEEENNSSELDNKKNVDKRSFF